MSTIYFIIRSDSVLITNSSGLPEVWANKVLCEAMKIHLNDLSKHHDLPYTFEIVESQSIDNY